MLANNAVTNVWNNDEIDIEQVLLEEIWNGLEKYKINPRGVLCNRLWVEINKTEWDLIPDRFGNKQKTEGCMISYNPRSTEIEVVIPTKLVVSSKIFPEPKYVPFGRAVYCFNISKEGAIDRAIKITRLIYNIRKNTTLNVIAWIASYVVMLTTIIGTGYLVCDFLGII